MRQFRDPRKVQLLPNMTPLHTREMRNSAKLTVSRVVAVLALGGCTGRIGYVPPGGSPDRPGVGSTGTGTGAVGPTDMIMAQTCTPSIPPAPLRRLSNAEYQATMKDLIGSLNMAAPTIVRD